MKEKFWKFVWAFGIYGWGIGMMVQLLGLVFKDDDWNPSVTVFILWVILPVIWMLCISLGFGLYDNYKHELGLQEHTTPEGYRKVDDTTPAKRITLLWLAPFALLYFVVRDKLRQHHATSAR